MSIKFLVDSDVFFPAMFRGHPSHDACRAWLDANKRHGWGIALETYLSALRQLTNAAQMKEAVRTASAAFAIIDKELAGAHPCKIVYASAPPDRAIIGKATGHKQVMDFWLVQLARQEKCKLATRDNGTLVNWPDDTARVPGA